MTWRRTPLPAEWPRIRRAVLARDEGRCTEVMPDGSRCTHDATDVHHIGYDTDHSEGNLRAVCAWHHRRHTSARANAMRKRVTQRHPGEPHAGVL